MSKGKIITGVLAAAAAGAVLGVLFAPDKGSKTRKKIMRQQSDFKDSLKDKINDFVDEVSDQYESIKGRATDMMEKGKAVKADSKHSLS